ncbi:C-terminal binding protein [Candidatus Spongiisocius sp.]|uniref:C-terminal binding protein n=1 Tax=Candidatus Spongiisocius sp. TaxID=3101273 RepID=UPI003B593D20
MTGRLVVGVEGPGTPARDWSVERDLLDAAGAALVTSICASEEEAAAALRDADAGLVHTSPITGVILDAASKCRALILGGVGHEHVDLELASERGIAVANVPDYCVEEVSDHALALLLALARGLIPLDASSRRGEWDHRGGGRLARIRGCRLGLYGFGRIARRLAEKARGIGLAVMAFDPYVDHSEMRDTSVMPAESLAQLLGSSDFVSLHTHQTPETEHVINADSIRLMKPGARLVNVSRGALIEEGALYEALRSGHLAGAALDVMAVEPFDTRSPLLELDNLVVTPHAAWYSEQSKRELSRKMAGAAIQALRGELPDYTINTPAGRRFSWLDS